MMRRTQTVIVGGGQAGLALSHHLTVADHDHVVLERGRIGERWHSERWDSLVLLTPNWLNELPGAGEHDEEDGFLGREGFVEYLNAYAGSFGAPVEEGVTVLAVEQSGNGVRIETDLGTWLAANVVVATALLTLFCRPWPPARHAGWFSCIRAATAPRRSFRAVVCSW
jgi:putative flavoprotein involved in K+ transport